LQNRHFFGEQAEHANERTLNLTTLVEATAYPPLRQIHGCISSAVPTEREGYGSAGVDPIRVDGTGGPV